LKSANPGAFGVNFLFGNCRSLQKTAFLKRTLPYAICHLPDHAMESATAIAVVAE
jgi:hypothetical protein